uniref:acid phosphatase n=2 Tax=Sipha flava TaxID=143950 RepID=A0A2S2R667_9HEMI
MYHKGKVLRRLYNRFIDDVYLEHEILIKCTIISRTYVSAAMVLAGMYPPKYYQEWSDSETVWQPIPISNDSPDQTAIFRTHKCPYTNYFVKKDYDNIITNKNKKQIEELLSYLTKKLKKPINVEQIHIIYDIIASRISNGFQLPEWIKPKFIKIMKSVSIEHFKRMYGNKKIQKLISGPLLKEISLNMQLRSDNSNYKTTKNMYLYAGHDISLGTVLYFLGNRSIITPDFGASIHFHLYLDKTVGYIVKVFYYSRWDDDKGEEILIPACGNPCELEYFTKRINRHFSTDWEEECKEMEN